MAEITLSSAEIKLVAAVFSQMKELPAADWEEVAKIVGIKYAKNARQSFKKVFDKLHNGGKLTTAGDEDNGGVEAPKKAAPAKKAAEPRIAKKGIAKPIAPRKSAPRKAKKQIKEEPAEENEDIEMESEPEAGKFLMNNFTPINAKSSTSFAVKDSTSPSMTGYQASASSNEVESNDEDRRNAAMRGIGLEQWLAWKRENDYDEHSHAPTPTNYLSEEEA